MADIYPVSFPRTMKVKDFKACASGFVSIHSYNFAECLFSGIVDNIPFCYLDCWVAGLNYSSYYDEFDKMCRTCFVIQLES